MKISYRFTLLAAMLVPALLICPTEAKSGVPGYADFLPAWQCVGSSCMVDEGSLTKYNNHLNYFGFKYGTTGWITSRCTVLSPLPTSSPNWDGLIVDYIDADGMGGASQVKVYLRRYARATGLTYTIAVFDSNTSPITTRTEGLQKFQHIFDFLNNEYYVELTAYRANSSTYPRIHAVRVCPVSGIPN